MWLKLALLLIYVTVLFILARCLEVLTWHELGHLSQRFLDPMTLSVLRLKALLEQRGVSYEGVLEKSELTELVDATGQVTGGELSELDLSTEEDTQLTNFTCGSHFYEQVEDTKDSVWLIKVHADQRHSILSDSVWKSIRKKVNRFGVNAGIFDCNLDWRLCRRKEWNTSRLILALPQDFRTKSNVALHTYSGAMKVNSIYEWIRTTVEKKVEKIQDFESFQSKWMSLHQQNFHSEIRVIFFSKRDIMMPLFYSALSVKFPGRVRFGMVNTVTPSGQNISKHIHSKSSPAYFVMTSERSFLYGERVGERLTFRSMEKFFRWFYPGVNDLFIASLVVVNICSCLEFFLVQGTFFRRLWKFSLCISKFNIFLVLTWIILLAVFQLSLMQAVTLWGLKLIRYFSDTNIACYLRNDFLIYSSSSNIFFVCLSLLSFMFVVGIIEYRRTNGEIREETESEIWNFAQFRTLEHLFTPTVSLARTHLGYSHSLLHSIRDDDHDHTTPTLWLQSPVAHDYMQHLPVWKFSPPKIIVPPKSDITDNPELINQNNDHASYAGCDGHQVNSTGNLSESNMDFQNPCYQHVSADSLLDSNYRCECGTEQNLLDRDKKVNSGDRHVIEVEASRSKSESHDHSYRDDMPKGFLYASQCVICLDNYQVGDLLCGLPCWHAFHKHCIMTWLTRDNHFCPICRWYSYKPKSDVHLHSD